MPINYQALRGEDVAGQIPEDGTHEAVLDRAALVKTEKGERLVTEWTSVDGATGWTSWNRFDQTGLEYTRELLSGLGIELAAVNDDDALTDALSAVEGHVFNVRTSSQKGSQGDRWFTSTYVNGRSQGVQEILDPDLPVETGGLSDPPAETDDETIPF